eukprot:TRINITY_DN9005_c0_g1_i1.p1 TRINITY_DN9005_c0_g1~~TRINITY_DN9005_c0_g1_i1.p1  ORF type:complete len:534 (+),score=151.68 TRINITY_DN9005_c0_g1_i1:98-1699(+)
MVGGIAAVAAKDPSRPFAIQGETAATVSWGEHAANIENLARYLFANGITEEAKVVVYGNNSYEWILARDTAYRVGMCFVPMNWHLAAPEIAYCVDNCDASVLVVEAAFLPTLAKARAAAPELFAKLRHVLVWGAAAGAALPDGAVSVTAACAAGGPRSPPPPTLVGRAMLYTGGTSGKPKAVVVGGRGARASAASAAGAAAAAQLGPQGLNLMHPQQVHIAAAPLYHSAPNMLQHTCELQGATTVIMRRFSAELCLDLIKRYRVTTSFMPPILVKRLADAPRRPGEDLSSLRSVLVAGAPCPMPVKKAALERGIPLYEFYGSSELGINSVLQPQDMLRKPNSCGRIAQGVSLKIVDDQGRECPRNTPGEIYIQKPVTYYKAPEKAKKAQLKTDPSYTSVGDVGFVDDEGFLFICDRKIDMIISGGANIYPAEIEQVLFQHPAVADVGVFGTPDSDYGERVHAAVLLKPGGQVSAPELQAWAKERIAAFKVPKDISFHSDFPRTPSGKLIKRQLRDKFWQGGALAHTVAAAAKL